MNIARYGTARMYLLLNLSSWTGQQSEPQQKVFYAEKLFLFNTPCYRVMWSSYRYTVQLYHMGIKTYRYNLLHVRAVS
jgi:hypothetical protein